VPSYTVHRADDGVKKRLVVEVSLPGIASGADLIVSVREADKSLYIRAPGRYKLTVPLGVPVEGVAEGVKFVRKKAVLKVGAVVLH
jgi:HSP20 family molecular chaperone IbpA